MDKPDQLISDRRKFTRVPVAMEVQVLSRNSLILSPSTKDVSMNGLFMITEKKLPVGSECQLTIFLGGRESQERIEIAARVVRETNEGMALQFKEFMGTNSFSHLRNLVLYNAQDAEKIENEIDRAGKKTP